MRAPNFWQHRGAIARLLAPLGTLYGMSVAGWNVRWRLLEGDRVEVCALERLGVE